MDLLKNHKVMNTMELSYEGYDLEVKFEYTPGEEMVMYYPDGSGHPGSDPEITLGSVIIPGLEVEILPLLTDKQKRELEDRVYELFHEYNAD